MTEPVIPALLVQFSMALWKRNGYAVSTAAWLILTTLGGLVFRLGQRFLVERACTNLNANLFTMAVQRLLARPLEWFWENHTGAMQVRLERSSRGMAELVRLAATDALPPLASAGNRNDPYLAADPRRNRRLHGGPAPAGGSDGGSDSQPNGIRGRLNRVREELGASVADAVGGIEQVKLYEAEAREAKRVGAVAESLAGTELAHHRVMAVFDLGKQLAERTGLVFLIIWVCACRSGRTSRSMSSR